MVFHCWNHPCPSSRTVLGGEIPTLTLVGTSVYCELDISRATSSETWGIHSCLSSLEAVMSHCCSVVQLNWLIV